MCEQMIGTLLAHFGVPIKNAPVTPVFCRSYKSAFDGTERVGFEPTVPFWGTRHFQCRTFGHSVTSPEGAYHTTSFTG